MTEIDDFRKQVVTGKTSLQQMIETVAQSNHNGLIGTKYVDQGKDWVELAIGYDEKLVGDPTTGILASGPIISLCDMASGMSIMLASRRFMPAVTIDLRVDYLRPAKVGQQVNARMTCYRTTRSVAFVRGLAHDGDPDDPIAHATGTFMFLESSQ
jgi:uncharacterized protein (TIGR00369 family)